MERRVTFYEETSFKTTEIGEIPADWEAVKLGELANIQIGRTPARKEKESWENGSFPWVSISDMKPFGTITETKEKISNYALEKYFKNVSRAGTLLMSFKLTIGRTSILAIDAVHNEAIVSIYPIGSIDKMYLLYYLPTIDFSKYFDKAVKGNTLNKDKMLVIPIAIPPVEEQKAIAYVLSAVQEAREKTEKVIEAAKELKKSLMKHLFTYGPVSLEEASRINLKETEIGLIPESWEVAKLGEMQAKGFLKLKNGLAQGNWNDEGNGIPQIRPFNITEDGRITLQAVKYIQPFDNIKDYKLHLGDVIFDNTNSEELVGKTAYWNIEGDFTLSNHMTIIRVLKREIVNPVFLSSYLHKNWTDKVYLRIRRRYVNQASVTLTVLKELSIPLPPLAVQQRIAEILQTVDEKIQAEEKKKQALDNLFNSMLHMLMSGKLRVKFRTGEEEESG